METPKGIEGPSPKLQIAWLPQNADQSLEKRVIFRPRHLVAKLFGADVEKVPDQYEGQPWPNSTTPNQFFKMVQEMLEIPINIELGIVEGMVQYIIEYVQARDELMARAYGQMQTEVQLVSQHIKELTELKEPELMDWEPTSQLTIPDFEQMIDEKIRMELYHCRTEVVPSLAPTKTKGKRKSL